MANLSPSNKPQDVLAYREENRRRLGVSQSEYRILQVELRDTNHEKFGTLQSWLQNGADVYVEKFHSTPVSAVQQETFHEQE